MDLYILLGVEREATLDDIKRAYRRLARRLHPDINPGDRLAAERFRQIAEAYETLCDPDRRQQYDSHGPAEARAEPPAYGFEGFDFSVNAYGAAASTFGELFADVLNARAAPEAAHAPERGADLHQQIALSFTEAMRGGVRRISVARQHHCQACQGRGRLAAATTPCSSCGGSGVVKSARGHMVFSKPCAPCGGAGLQAEARCPSCGGRQFQMRAESIAVSLPPGLDDGAVIRAAGQGHAGANGGAAGDLVVTVRVEPHPVFRRDGDDLHVVVPVAVHEAALGAKVQVPGLDGPVRLRVPPGTQSGQRLRLRERGVPSRRDGRRGDLVVEVRLVLPRVLDERSKELLREFGRLNSEDVRSWP
jgi:molecular chaperone DnaJ